MPEARRKLDPLTVGAAIFFVLAAAMASIPAFRAGGETGAGLMLLVGVAALSLLTVFALLTASRQPAEPLQLEAAVDALDEPAAAVGADGRIVRANAGWEREVGLARLAGGEEGASLYAAFAAARRGETAPFALEAGRALRVTRLSEDRFLVRAAPPPAAPSRAVPAVAAPVAAVSAAHALDVFAAAAPFGAAALDGRDPFDAVIVEANPALRAITQGRAAPGMRFGELIEPGAVVEARAKLAAKPGLPVEVRLAHDPHRTAHLYVGSADGRLAAYLLDVSEQKRLELQLAQSHKMQAIGQLAGGVAHDFNNLLTAIQLRLDELLHRHPVGDPSYEGLNEIRQTAVRAADLVRKLLSFSRKQTVQRETLDLGEVISEFEVLLRRLMREDVRLETDYGRDLPLVRADKSQLETAVMNLAVNARDAVRAQGGGVVKIRTCRLAQDQAIRLGFAGAGPGEHAMIEVGDNGPGIPPEVLSKIFEPFYTTKPVGEGTGLGLATVYGIVDKAEGYIHVESQPGQGAAFRIFLPVWKPAAGESAVAVRPEPKARPAARDLSGAGRILFVEDEDAVRGVAARLLRARGYEVIEACDGEEALELAQTHAGQIDLLISDVIMPGMDGPTLLKKARGYLGSAPVMFISGYAAEEFSDLLEGEDGVTFLPKPIDIKILAERVKQELGRA
jgi:two-component system cell cycle sensor histidine kinase/response regulator CckA